MLSHGPFEEIFNAARRYGVDVCLMGWGPESHGAPGRAETAIDELAHSLPCDFLVFKHRGFDPSRVLVPTAGGPDSDLAAAIARTLRDQLDATITLLHVADDREQGRTFLRSWAADHDLADAELRVVTGDVQTRIAEAADDATLLIIGATERGVLSRIVRGSLVLGVLEEVDCSVLLAEKRHERTLRERLFGMSVSAGATAETGVTTEASTPEVEGSDEGDESHVDVPDDGDE